MDLFLQELRVLKSSRTSLAAGRIHQLPPLNSHLFPLASTAVLDQAPGCHSNLSAHPFSWDCHSLIIGPFVGLCVGVAMLSLSRGLLNAEAAKARLQQLEAGQTDVGG